MALIKLDGGLNGAIFRSCFFRCPPSRKCFYRRPWWYLIFMLMH